ncbi:MAG: DNA adenine methylase [Phycisphaerales bacterium]|nr:DNA adenine methylase [Phycisphaerales bacterium]
MIKYIGSKRTLIPAIVGIIDELPDVRSVIDLFSGTSRVGHALKKRGYQVFANDHNAYAAALARCYIQADRNDIERDAMLLIDELRSLRGTPGYFTEQYCTLARYIQPKNGERIDAIRDAIAAKSLGPELEAVLLVSLMEAADRVDSTTGLQMAYLKSWAPRSHNDLELRMPDVLPRARCGKGQAHHGEAIDAARTLTADVAYLDPPYNQHSYLGNYHIWETLVRWDRPEVYGVARKRIDCKTRRSPFNSKQAIHQALADVAQAIQAPILIVSFSDEGYITRDALEEMLATRGSVITLEHDCKRYVGAQIGIHNPAGEKVGTISHLRNREYLFVAGPADRIERISHISHCGAAAHT